MSCGCKKNREALRMALAKVEQEKLLTNDQIRQKDIESQNSIIRDLQGILGLLEGGL